MNGHATGCMICGRPLRYFDERREMECAVCHRRLPADAACEAGHFVCDDCHRGDLTPAEAVCLASTSRDPTAILTDLMRLPGTHMHGPEHHVLVGSALLAAYRNAGNAIDLGRALAEMRSRGSQVPGGVCGMWGCCGAAVSCGMACSIITGTTPLSGDTWGMCNRMTARCLEAIGSTGGPRCCKRDGYSALVAASGFLNEELDAGLELPDRIECGFSDLNAQCLGGHCPYSVSRARGRPRSSPSRWAWCRPRRPLPLSWRRSRPRRP